MPLQRYDIPVRDAPTAFARRFWTPVNSPLHDEAGLRAIIATTDQAVSGS